MREAAQTRAHCVASAWGTLHAREWWPVRARGARPQGDSDGAPPAPIVLLHDSLGSVELWREFPAALADATGRRVIAYDRPGFGRSDRRSEALAAGFIVDEAYEGFDAVREALGIRRFIAFGHSVGGGMAVGCAAAWPGDCVGLVTESAQAFVEDRTVTGIEAARAAFAQPGQRARLAKYHGDRVPWVLSAWIDRWLSPGFADWSLDAVLPRVRAPTLALHGTHDEFGSVEHPRRIAAGVSGPHCMVLLDGCGHVPHREQPSRVLNDVADWLAPLE